MSSTKLKTANIVSLDATKLTGTMPAISGANLTGVSPFTVSASDPAVATNPSGGVGTLWMNSTSSETYVCTDATAGENVWTNVGEGSGDVWDWQGTQNGFNSGGTSGGVARTSIDKFAFASNVTASGHGNLSLGRSGVTGHSSYTNEHGYSAGGYIFAPAETANNTIDKFAFASNTTAADWNDLTVARYAPASIDSKTYGFQVGGNGNSNVVDKFSFATSAAATDHGDMSIASADAGGWSTPHYGYTAGGYNSSTSPTNQNHIQKFSTVSSSNSSLIATLTQPRNGPACSNSETHGYAAAGQGITGPNNSFTTSIDKFAFDSGSTSAGHGNLVVGFHPSGGYGASSTTHGFVCGGYVYPSQSPVTINKFAFASNTTAADHGDLVQARSGSAPHQQ